MDKKLFLTQTAPVERLVKLPDGTEAKLLFKPVTGGEFFRFQKEARAEDDTLRNFAMQRLIACSLCEDARGRPALTTEEAKLLSIDAINALFPHVLAVSRTMPDAKKDSPSEVPTGSDTSSD